MMGRLPNDVRQKVIIDLKSYPKYQREIKELLADIATDSPPPADGQPKGRGQTSDPTYSALLRCHSSARVQHLERTCSAIDRCLFCIKGDIEACRRKQEMIEMLYFRQTHTITGVANELCYDVRTIQRWNRELIENVACELGYI